MGTYHTDPEIKQAYRSCGTALAFLVFGMLGFAAWSLSTIQGDPAADGNLWLQIKGYALSRTALVESLETAFLIVMTCVLVSLCRRARARSLKQILENNAQLKQDFQKVKKHESELQDAIRDLQRFNAMATGREQRILELKDEVNALLHELNRQKRYQTSPADQERMDRDG